MIPGYLVVKVNDAKTTRKQSTCSAYDNTKKHKSNQIKQKKEHKKHTKKERKSWYIQSAKDQKKSDKVDESKSKIYT